MSPTRSSVPGRITAFVLVLAMPIGGAVAVHLFGKPAPPPPARANADVQRVLRDYTRLSAKYLHAKPGTPPSQYAAAIGRMSNELEQHDMSACPTDFRIACAQNIRALRATQALLNRYPDGFLEGVAMGAMNFLVRGEADGGLTRLQNDVQESLKRIRFTSDEVERIAAKYTE